MKIGVNARLLSQPYTGIGQYTINLFKKMAEISPGDEFVLVTNKKTDEKFPPNVIVKVIPEKKWLIFNGLRKGWWEQIQVPKFFKNNKFDISHFTYPAYPLKPLKTPSVITIHDMIQFTDTRYSRKSRSKIYFWLVKKTLLKAVKNPRVEFTAVSETTADEFRKIFPRSKITTIHEGASEEFLRPIRTKTDIRKPYLLYVGGYDPRKNVKYLLEVFARVQKEIPEMQLILCAGQNFKGLPKIINGVTLNTLETGFVNDEELNALYKEADAFINLSENEGFNLPVLQSAYAGTPIIISDIPVHRELYAVHGLLLPTIDSKKASEEIVGFLRNDALKEKFKKEMSILRTKYTWDKAAKKNYQLYLKII